MKKQFYSTYATLIALILLIATSSCGGGGSGESMSDDGPIGEDSPLVATLIFPVENETCNEGVTVSDTQSRVTFQWTASENTDSYEVSLRDLNTNTVETTLSNTNEVDIVLSRGTPYEWYVISKADGVNSTAESEKWKFYNQGLGLTFYAPFPAEATNPKQGETVSTAGSLTLRWNTSDVDNDITGYDVFFGTAANPTANIGNTTQSSANVTVTSGLTYYWRIVTSDAQGNTSESGNF